jgi:hypothetical protein
VRRRRDPARGHLSERAAHAVDEEGDETRVVEVLAHRVDPDGTFEPGLGERLG